MRSYAGEYERAQYGHSAAIASANTSKVPERLCYSGCGNVIIWLACIRDIRYTEVPAYSDTLGTWEKCHCNQIVTVSRGSLVTNWSIGTCQKSHCKRGGTVNSVTVSGEICTHIYETLQRHGNNNLRNRVQFQSIRNRWGCAHHVAS